MKKLMLFLVIAVPILVILIVKLTATVTVGEVFISVESITLDHDSIKALVGENLDLSYSIYPEIATNKDVIWNSDNESVAVVDSNGHVDFIGIGSGYISAITQDGNMRAQCYFYVYDTKVHNVELTSPQKFVHIGDTLQLGVEVLPDEALNKSVYFTSSNKEIATVDSNGLVRGKKEGYVTITVTCEDGNFTDSIDLLIGNPVTSLRVDKTEIISSVNDIHLEYIIEPFNATLKNVDFIVDKPEIATVNHLGIVNFLKAGEVNIKLITQDGGFEQSVHVVYTAGYAYDLILNELTLNMNVNDAPRYIEYQTLPEHFSKTQVQFESDDENVAYVDQSGYIHAVKGGNTVIRLKVQKSEEEIIEKQIYLNVQSFATSIDIEDVYTAQRNVTLEPKSLPKDSTNTSYFYHIDDETKATVSKNGEITFISNEICSVNVTIYANEDYSDVFKKIRVTYTAGKVANFKLLDTQKTLMFGEKTKLNYVVVPENIESSNFNISLISSSPVIQNGSVIEIMDNGNILAVGGGKARVKVSVNLFDGNIIEQYCDIEVLHNPEDIDINVDLNLYNDKYITSNNIIPFSATILPLDATDVNVLWTLSDNKIAFINENKLIFNQIGSAILTATVGEISKSIEIYYTGLNPVGADVRAKFLNETIPIPNKLQVGDSFEIVIDNLIPNDIENPQILIQAKNQKTVNSNGTVLLIEKNIVTAVAGGTSTLIVLVSNSLRFDFEIEVERKPQSLSVLQADTRVTTTTVNLFSEVLPFDTTNQNVIYTVQNEDVAVIQGSILTFKKNGIAYITAKCEADEKIKLDFFIEKVNKDIVYISPQEKNVSINKGDILSYNIQENYRIEILQDNPIIPGEKVATVDGKFLRTLCAGNVLVKVTVGNKSYENQIEVKQLVEHIVYLGDLELYNGEYVTAKDVVDLNLGVFPQIADNKDYTVSIIKSFSMEGEKEKIAFISNKIIYFTKAGSITIEVKSKDGNFTTMFSFCYTGGDALDGILNVENTLLLDIGEQSTINIVKWIPFDTSNTFFAIYEVNASTKKVIEINSKTNTITAVDYGETKLVVELSNGIVKEVKVIVRCPAVDIEVEENVLIAGDTYIINAVVIPKDATTKDLEYILQNNQVATLIGNVLHFTKAGAVNVVVRTKDGSGVEKIIKVTSTFGKLNGLKLNCESKQIEPGETFKIEVSKIPFDSKQVIQYKILSQKTSDGTNQNVINLSSEGEITGLYGGTAVVRVYVIDEDGKEIFADCQITVISQLLNIEIKFETELEQYQNQNTFITSKNELGFEVIFNPQDATERDCRFEISNPNLAKIEDSNKIVFLQKGRVSITFLCGDCYKIYNFYYVGDDLIEAKLNKDGIVNNTIYLNAGESFNFKLIKVTPKDNVLYKFSIKDIVENRYDINKPVANFENGVLYALNGGIYTFSLYANNLKLETLTLIVNQDVKDIKIIGDEEVYISTPSYTIFATVLPSDATQTKIGFISLNQDIATVTSEGVVTFKSMGECKIKVYVIDNPLIYKIVDIKYTNMIEAIKFGESKENAYVKEHIDISVYALPQADIEYEMTIDNPNIADIIKREEGYRLIGKASGSVTVTAKVVGKDIFATKVFNFFDKISDLKLELDNSGDLSGHGEYRVFGNNFYNSSKALTNTYQMKVSMIPNIVSNDLLEWFSSDESVAKVDKNGIVTFVGIGKVTITVKQKVLYEGAKVVSDSYQFTIVKGINVESFEEFKLAHSELTKRNSVLNDDLFSLVLQNDIHIEKDFGVVKFNYNILGNGKMLDISQFTSNWYRFYLAKNNVVIDNVILRGTSFTAGEQLKDTGNTLMIENCSNVLLYNCIIENADVGIRILASQVLMQGCIIRNCLSVGVRIARTEKAVTNLTVEDCIFTSSFCGILIIMDNYQNAEKSVITLKGEVRFYNWSKLDQIETAIDLQKIFSKIGLSFATGEIIKQVKEIASKNSDYAYSYNGEDYYNFGVFTLDGTALGIHYSGEFKSITEVNPTCNYKWVQFSGALNFGVAIPLTVTAFTLSASNPFIKPGDTYIGNTALLDKIKKPCRV